MEIHKPKPWHGVREFLKEYLIIFIGVLTALGAEQLVESAQWARRVAETRTQLSHELSENTDSGLHWLSRAPCLEAQLAALRTGVAEARRTGVFHAPAQRYAPPLDKFSTDAWLNARSLQVSDHMSPDEVAGYSSVYFYPAELVGNITTLHSLAGELAPLAHDLDHVSPAEADELTARIGRIQELQTRTELAMVLMIRGSDRVHAPMRPPAISPSETFAGCSADPARVLAVARDHSLSLRDVFSRLNLGFFFPEEQ